MTDEATATAEDATQADEKAREETVPYERFTKVNQQAKEAKAQTVALQKQLDDLKAQMDERETAGLPELERERKRAEQLEKRAQEAEQKATEADAKLARSQKERWVTAAAKDFADPADAVAFVDLDAIEEEKDAERAVKRLAGQKKHLLKAEEPVLPGRVLQNGQQPATAANGGINPSAEAEMLAGSLKDFLASRQR